MNTEDGLTNGASCQVMKVDNSNTYASGTIWVKFLDTSIGKTLRSEKRDCIRLAMIKAGYRFNQCLKNFWKEKKNEPRFKYTNSH